MLACVLASLPLALFGCRDTMDPFARLPGGSDARLVTVADTVMPAADTYIRQTLPNTNWGTDTMLQVGGGGKNRVLVRFDSAAIRSAVGAGTLDSAWVEFTIKSYPQSGWGDNGRTVDLHRLLKTWTEAGATWNCAIDNEPQNSSADCAATSWDMTNNGNGTYVSTKTDRVTLVNNQTGVIRLNVTADVQGFLYGTSVHQGWMFRKTNEATGGEALVLSRESGSEPRLVLSVSQDDGPLPTPPSAIAWPSPRLEVVHPTDSTAKYYRNVVGIQFDTTARAGTLNNLLQKYSATVIAGFGVGTPVTYYLLQVPDPGPTWAAWLALESTLRAEKGVLNVRHYRSTPDFKGIRRRYPSDSLASSRASWEGQGSDSTWPWIAVRAPLAWGCETGTYGGTPPKVAILDFMFDNIAADLGVPSSRRFTYPANQLTPWPDQDHLQWAGHGHRVASIFGALGNNGSGMAGMMWASDLELYAQHAGSGYQDGAQTIVDGSIRAVARGVRILSYSGGAGRPDDVGDLNAIRDAFRRFLDSGNDRLLVIAAGNDSTYITMQALAAATTGPWWATDRAAAQLLTDPAYNGAYDGRILFVAGTDRAGTLAGFSNMITGEPQAVIAAPADDFYALEPNGQLAEDFGTSYAAPMVAGVAAMLWTRVPSLSAPEVVNFLIEGAKQNRVANGSLVTPTHVPGWTDLYQLDAYGALKLLASTVPNSPLCGNDVWLSNGVLKARRGAGTEQIASLSDTAGLVNARHGGRRVDILTTASQYGGFKGFSYFGTTPHWRDVGDPFAVPDSFPGGTFAGSLFTSHDLDSSVSYLTTGSGFDVRLHTPSGTTTLGSIPTSWSWSGSAQCIRKERPDSVSTYTCYATQAMGTTIRKWPRVSFSPVGDRVLVAVNTEEETVYIGSNWVPCPGTDSVGTPREPRFICVDYSGIRTTTGFDLWAFPLPSGSPQQVLTSTDGPAIWWLGVSEDGTGIVVGSGTQISSWVADPANNWATFGHSTTYPGCAVRFYSPNFALTNTPELALEACIPFESAGTIAPIRRVGSPTSVTPRPTPRRSR